MIKKKCISLLAPSYETNVCVCVQSSSASDVKQLCLQLPQIHVISRDFHCVFFSSQHKTRNSSHPAIGLPQHCILAITPCAACLSCLVSHLQLPCHGVLVMWVRVLVPGVVIRALCVQCDRVVLTGAGAEVHRGPTAQQGVFVTGRPALAPGSYFKAVLVFALPSRAVSSVRASPGFCQVGAVHPSVHGRGQDVSSPMLQASAAGFAAAGPRGEV